jgi:hypothetical protein
MYQRAGGKMSEQGVAKNEKSISEAARLIDRWEYGQLNKKVDKNVVWTVTKKENIMPERVILEMCLAWTLMNKMIEWKWKTLVSASGANKILIKNGKDMKKIFQENLNFFIALLRPQTLVE